MRYFTRRQHLTTLIESNVTGPPKPIRVLGVPVQELIPVGVIAGNLAIAFLAFSYARAAHGHHLVRRGPVP